MADRRTTATTVQDRGQDASREAAHDGEETARAYDMKLNTEQSGDITIVRVGESRLMYPMLADFTAAVTGVLASGQHEILIDLTPVTYVDSATIGCLMDLYRQARAANGRLKL